MKARPSHRWKSLWLGVLVVCCLAWAWRDSLRFHSGVGYRGVNASNTGGAIHFGYVSQGSPGAPVGWMRFEMAKTFPTLTVPAFVPPLLLRGEGRMDEHFLLGPGMVPSTYHEAVKHAFHIRPRADWLVAIPHWLVILAFVGAWAGFLVWRVSRQRNLTA